MKKMRLSHVMLAIVAMVGVTPASYAGSERLIMTMTSKRMLQEQLIHVRFFGPDSAVLESDTMKKMAIQDCNSGKVFEMVKDYKIGYAPENKVVGMYLFPKAWKNNTLCFSVPSLGKAEKKFTSEDVNGQSIHLNMVQ